MARPSDHPVEPPIADRRSPRGLAGKPAPDAFAPRHGARVTDAARDFDAGAARGGAPAAPRPHLHDGKSPSGRRPIVDSASAGRSGGPAPAPAIHRERTAA